MHAVILAAGEGSRMGAYTADRPKPFIEVGGRTLFDRQYELVADCADECTVVLGYAAENVRDQVENVRGQVENVQTIVVSDWREYDNAESLRRALDRITDDTLVCNGDIVVSESVVASLLACHRRQQQSIVGCLPGIQHEHTAIQCTADGDVIEYGMIPGHRHAGIGVIDQRDRKAALDWLERNPTEWYPGLYPVVGATRAFVPPGEHVEINRPSDIDRARRQFPLEETADESTVQTE